MAKQPLAKTLQFEKKNKDMLKLPKCTVLSKSTPDRTKPTNKTNTDARVQKRPIPHSPVASPYAGASVPKIVYVSTKSPFMSAVKRVQKLLRQAEKRATSAVNLSSSKRTDRQKLAEVARGQEQLSKEEVFVKGTGRAIEKALSVGRWFEERGNEYAVRVKTGSVLVVDDVEEDEEAKRKAIEEAERVLQQEQAQEEKKVDEKDDGQTAPDQSVDAPAQPVSKSETKKRKRAANALASASGEELPETRTRWVNMVEIAVTLK
jgi:ribonuclease P/MRP protein subunit POP7